MKVRKVRGPILNKLYAELKWVAPEVRRGLSCGLW